MIVCEQPPVVPINHSSYIIWLIFYPSLLGITAQNSSYILCTWSVMDCMWSYWQKSTEVFHLNREFYISSELLYKQLCTCVYCIDMHNFVHSYMILMLHLLLKIYSAWSLYACYTYSLLDLPLTFVEHVVDLRGFAFGALSVVDRTDIQHHST